MKLINKGVDMVHITQMIDQVCEDVSNIKVVQCRFLMDIMAYEDLTLWQKKTISDLITPLEAAISKAQASFTREVVCKDGLIGCNRINCSGAYHETN